MNTEHSTDLISTIALRNDGRAPTGEFDTADSRHYDDYFRIDRGEDPAVWWGGAQRVAWMVVYDLHDAGLHENHRADLLAGISRLLLASTSAPGHSGPPLPAPLESYGKSGTAARRWKLGHHLFHHVLSLMNSRADGIVAAVAKPDWDTARALVDELTVLIHATELKAPRAADGLEMSTVDSVYVPGGYAPMAQLHDHIAVATLLGAAVEKNAPIATVCHGAAALLALNGVPGTTWPFAGQVLTGFSDAEEDLLGNTAKLAWTLEQSLVAAGAEYRCAAPWSEHVREQPGLVTGQNPASSMAVAKALLKQIG
ncbi:DJ-1/PfpI family protein [Saccharopolyspora phatthalungensis]|uniref:Putative intracellular protease/amidase n=1 Tax=Saccharopolyspora phatthalungensis TaxID=664693 RepID=A0A840QFP8_9PSEU|nr:DJ-1/PfpI family protein [Saccharopolyspora phatthalungensis]MBB5159266.1 putative intracellular protease/amidase [Saccharopolyspora phatthalungensis]